MRIRGCKGSRNHLLGKDPPAINFTICGQLNSYLKLFWPFPHLPFPRFPLFQIFAQMRIRGCKGSRNHLLGKDLPAINFTICGQLNSYLKLFWPFPHLPFPRFPLFQIFAQMRIRGCKGSRNHLLGKDLPAINRMRPAQKISPELQQMEQNVDFPNIDNILEGKGSKKKTLKKKKLKGVGWGTVPHQTNSFEF